MRVTIRLGRGTKVVRREPRRHSFSLALSSLLTPSAVAAAILGAWRIAADLNWTGDFVIGSGFFSHWQVWLVAAALLQTASRLLYRYGTAPKPGRSRGTAV